jgi:hypothetical protein
LHLVGHRSALKHRIHATLLAHGRPCAVSDLVTSDSPEPLADGAAFTGVGLQRLFGPIVACNMVLLGRFRAGVEPDSINRTGSGSLRWRPASVPGPSCRSRSTLCDKWSTCR